jgi:hypothetical protein
MAWRAPWTAGLAQEPCSLCGVPCVAVTLDSSGRCRQCVVRGLPPAKAEPVEEAEPLFDPDRAA